MDSVLEHFVSQEGFSSQKSLMGTVWYQKLKENNNSNNKNEELYAQIYFFGHGWTFSFQIILQSIKSTINRIKLFHRRAHFKIFSWVYLYGKTHVYFERIFFC